MHHTLHTAELPVAPHRANGSDGGIGVWGKEEACLGNPSPDSQMPLSELSHSRGLLMLEHYWCMMALNMSFLPSSFYPNVGFVCYLRVLSLHHFYRGDIRVSGEGVAELTEHMILPLHSPTPMAESHDYVLYDIIHRNVEFLYSLSVISIIIVFLITTIILHNLLTISQTQIHSAVKRISIYPAL